MSDMMMKYKMKKRMAKGGCADCASGTCMAHGGEVKSPTSDAMDDDDLVMRIMKKRYAQGGEIHKEDEPIVDEMPADYDALDGKDGDMDFSYTGENSGDDLGDAAVEEDEKDLVARIMKSRSKKDRMPRPA